MEVRFTEHARAQLAERSISETDVVKTIHTPDKIIKQSPRRFRAIRKMRKDPPVSSYRNLRPAWRISRNCNRISNEQNQQISMRFNYHKSEDALYIRFDESPYKESDEVGEGIILDYDKKGKIVGIEILNASKKLSPAFRNALLKSKVPLHIGA